ncbi:MAG: zinc ribbon domain-containing protein [Acidobacteriia bacterium]|nr:zinc ribbon domain-containing protein [Terriglobia bacterium]
MRSLLLIWLLAGGLSAQTMKVEGPFKAKSGETCVVCNTPVSEDDDAFLVDGQRVAVMRAMREEFMLNPLLYVTRLRPEGMVFSSRQPETLSGVYLWMGLYVLIGLMFGGACAHMALVKGLSSRRWFFLGFFFSALAYLALAGKAVAENAPEAPAGLGKIPSTRSSAACPGCGAGNHPSSRQCGACGAALHPTASSEVASAARERQ